MKKLIIDDSKEKIIIVDYSKSQSIKKAERMKSRLENLGYIPVKTVKLGFDKWALHYKIKKVI